MQRQSFYKQVVLLVGPPLPLLCDRIRLANLCATVPLPKPDSAGVVGIQQRQRISSSG